MKAPVTTHRQRELIRQIEREATALGVQCEAVRTERSHLKFTLTLGSEKRMVFTSGTPSGNRSTKNCMAEIRRACRDLVRQHHHQHHHKEKGMNDVQ